MKVHLTGICGSGMSQLGRLFRDAGHEVRGSDISFDPPSGPELERLGVQMFKGYAAENLTWGPDTIVIGNAIRRDNPEAVAAAENTTAKSFSMSEALRTYFLAGRRAVIAAGTHGKTTTSSLLAHLFAKADFEPGYFIGGAPKDLPGGAAMGRTKAQLTSGSLRKSPFVVEGDEYDAVYWKKEPKFLDYVGASDSDVVILTSIEHDHIDIYPSKEAYLTAFRKLAAAIPENGILVCAAHDPDVRAISKDCKARVVYYALDRDDCGDITPTWQAATVPIDDAGIQSFDLFAGGVSAGRFSMRIPGEHNVRNAVAAIAALTEGFSVPFSSIRAGLATFTGVRRRQDLLGEPGGVRVYDDFAHHPTAVNETLRALRNKHRQGKLFAVFEPRSATACRALHQLEYPKSFDAADVVMFAPLGRTQIPEAERLDLSRLVHDLGPKAHATSGVDEIVASLQASAKAGDTIAILSNGAFGDIYTKLLTSLGKTP